MRYSNIQEEELKNKIALDFFDKFDWTNIIKDIDFAVRPKFDRGTDAQYLLWAEAKKSVADAAAMLAQLVLTVGKARTFDKYMPPPFLGCFDCSKIALIPYYEIQEIFYQNDFNWNVAPSDRKTKEFKQVYEQIKGIDDDKTYVFDFEKDETELRAFIKENFVVGINETSKTRIDKNNFINIYCKWLSAVKPTILVNNWDTTKKRGLLDGDFYLADLLSGENITLTEKLNVLLKSNYYETSRHINDMGFLASARVDFTDGQKAHAKFWAIYERPPLKEYWDYIIERRDLLVPQDVRERKGSFFTPQIWVELSQKYLADVFGVDWQDEYYVWDCAAGTGNLLAGLTNKYNIWASTLDKADVDVMHERIERGANLLADHCFQFDFLNDDFDKLPQGLRDIINDPKRREKLIVYINPPYAEAGSTATRVGTRENKTGVATENKTHIRYSEKLGKAKNELFALFLARAYFEIPGCKIGEFSKLKVFVAPNFNEFRMFFTAEFKKGFIIPADTFDNVSGKFPIGFKIWDTAGVAPFKSARVDVYDAKGARCGKKTYRDKKNRKYINDWIKGYKDDVNIASAKLCYVSSDFQNNKKVQICHIEKKVIAHDIVFNITSKNLIVAAIYFSVRKCIEATWLNDRDQFLYPNKKWENDTEFQNDCLAYTLFHNGNNITTKYGVNHWIPFMEHDVNARDKFDSHFMMSFIGGKLILNGYADLFEQKEDTFCITREFSAEAKAVFDAGRKLWTYYHAQKNININASLYDIREYFQGRNDKGKMNNKSDDETYNELISELRSAIKILAKKIEPKIYEYGFLLG